MTFSFRSNLRRDIRHYVQTQIPRQRHVNLKKKKKERKTPENDSDRNDPRTFCVINHHGEK